MHKNLLTVIVFKKMLTSYIHVVRFVEPNERNINFISLATYTYTYVNVCMCSYVLYVYIPFSENGPSYMQTYSFDFFNYAGIHRPVVLYTTPRIYISDVSIDTNFNRDIGKQIQITIVNIILILYNKLILIVFS